jgi:hypothetical protein
MSSDPYDPYIPAGQPATAPRSKNTTGAIQEVGFFFSLESIGFRRAREAACDAMDSKEHPQLGHSRTTASWLAMDDEYFADN